MAAGVVALVVALSRRQPFTQSHDGYSMTILGTISLSMFRLQYHYLFLNLVV